ncbi:anti-sigma factor [Caulobacter endophyticus]|uniref:Anti-sigma factor n=1 Tax=Caulobacter endophyticus TaxID=2172652 RepID=A0A2T9KBT6_9CAUL|nr:anti-sigma factor [Caulobacter endophyticus]PVM93333.1 anti-sigma factor [Caulobacter endophyticus]
MTVSDEEVFAYVDGELPPEAMARITAAMTKDPALAARIQAQRDLRRLLSGAHAGVLREPVPPGLKASVSAGSKPAEVIAFPQPKPKEKLKDKAKVHRPATPIAGRPAFRKPPAWAAMAACLVAGLAIGRLALPSPPTADGRAAEPPMAVGPLARALEDGASAQQAQGPVRIGLTFKSQAGRWCRTFQGQDQAGVACRADGAWRVLASSPATTPPAGGEYRQAASETPAAVMSVVDGMIAGVPLDAAGEAQALKSNWR